MPNVEVSEYLKILDRIRQITQSGVPYKVVTGNDLQWRGALPPYLVLADGRVEVIVPIDSDPKDEIKLPFVRWEDQNYGSRGGGKGFDIDPTDWDLWPKHKNALAKISRGGLVYPGSSPIEIHAIFDNNTGTTHYFLWEKRK